MNPYFEQNFWGFLQLFGRRLFSGEIFAPAPDEVQALVLMGVAASSALVGSFLVLRNLTMLANALSHTLLLGIVLAYLFVGGPEEHLTLDIPALLIASLFMGFLTTFLTQWLTHSFCLQEDAATGLVFTTLFALGIVAVTVLTRSAHLGTEAVMGNVDALHVDDLKLVGFVLFMNALLFVLFYKELMITSFDATLAQVLGISVPFFNYLLMGQASFVTIGSFRSTGVLMVLSFLVIPPLTARFFTHRLSHMMLGAALLGAMLSLLSVALSRHLLTVQGIALSTAGLTVTLLAATFFLAAVYSKLRVRTWAR